MIAIGTRERIADALRVASGHLLAAMRPEGYWEGRLSSSALSTATAMSALAGAGLECDAPLLRGGAVWLSSTQNSDGGWGDTPDSPSNLSTTLLALSALRLAGGFGGASGLSDPSDRSGLPAVAGSAEGYATRHAGSTPGERVAALARIYGADRTFAVPILMNCALAGLVPWEAIPGLPFEMAAFPQRAYRVLRLHVVSYALPALIAIGILLARRAPSRNPALRALRRALEPAALRKLEAIQPENGGFLEATPLTSFVAMSLLPLFGAGHPVARRCLGFLRASVRPDGSWPIDINLSAWVTTGAVSALAAARRLPDLDAARTREWLLNRQYHAEHLYTGAAPGGWSWTHLPGGVPDADDTSGALVALRLLAAGAPSAASLEAPMKSGAEWLLGLQNDDGGWPTFCRGWGKLPFDRSSPDLTAHALRALRASGERGPRIGRAVARGLAYLTRVQRPDGSWVPLWFGNQEAPGHANPVFGTARVLRALAEVGECDLPARRGIQYLVGAQGEDGGWGGDRACPASVEETALATGALALHARDVEARVVALRGAEALARWVEAGTWTRPAPIGLYFASLWYSEELYPVIWTVEALGRVLAHTGRED